jgi:uncharacterized membrane protein
MDRLLACYEGVTAAHLIWIFIIAGVLGFVLENLYCLGTSSVIESRQGLIYGPFSQIYGFGAVLLALVLVPLRQLGYIWVFIGGGVAGGVFEALCGIIQEVVFGSASWGYSHHNISFFGGRTSLKYVLIWGVLSVLYIRFFYPMCTSLVDRVPRKIRRVNTVVIVLILCADMGLSAIAVSRWAGRLSGNPAKSDIEVWLDERYPDEKLREIYPNMRFMETESPGTISGDESASLDTTDAG